MLVRTDGDVFHVRPGTCDEEVLRARYQRWRFLPAGLRIGPSDVVVDAGAHIGAFTVMAARAAVRGSVHALEPSEDNCRLLRANVQENALRNVTIHRVALGPGAGTGVLMHGADSWAHALAPNGGAGGDRELVPTETLEGFLAAQGLDRVDYLKMNVESAEYAVLLGAPEHALRRIRCMLVEYHPSAAHGPEELAERLGRHGFRVSTMADKGDRGKGWLAATA